jgi:hypothetical protein
MNHKYSTIFLIILLMLIAIFPVLAALTSSDVDEICAQNDSVLFRVNDTWGCGDISAFNINVTHINETYHFTQINESQGLNDVTAINPQTSDYVTFNMGARVKQGLTSDDDLTAWGEFTSNGNAYFNGYNYFYNPVYFQTQTTFNDDATFNNNVEIEGTLSSNDYTVLQQVDVQGFADFEDNVTVHDHIIFDNNETITSGYTYSPAGGYADFDGVNDYIDVSDHDELGNMSELTVSAWVNYHTFDGKLAGIVVKDDLTGANTQKSFALMFDDRFNTNRWSMGAVNASGVAGYTHTIYEYMEPNASQWYHMLGTWNGSSRQMQLYIDNVEVATTHVAASGTIKNSTIELLFGRTGHGGVFALNGSVDEVLIFDKYFSDTDVEEIYNLSRNFGAYNGTNKESLIAQWQFDDGTADDTYNTHNGTPTNGATIITEELEIDETITYFSGAISVTDLIYHSDVNTQDDVLNTFVDGKELLNSDGSINHKADPRCYIQTSKVNKNGETIIEDGWDASCEFARLKQAASRLNDALALKDLENKTMIDAEIISAETIYTESKTPKNDKTYLTEFNSAIFDKETHPSFEIIEGQGRLNFEDRMVRTEGALEEQSQINEIQRQFNQCVVDAQNFNKLKDCVAHIKVVS